ncbi:MAG TPA: dihydrolipoyl dehydrogenase [Xanthomonadaceae bacterium]|nr:dihydrolipoyl dehydrogenase [Xanthomonadaceae bacterium]
MAKSVEQKVPDIGDFDSVPVIEVLVSEGDHVDKDQGLVTLESDKATMEIPASQAGTIRRLRVKVGDAVSQGDVIAEIEPDPGEGGAAPGGSEKEKGAASAKDAEHAGPVEDGHVAADQDRQGSGRDRVRPPAEEARAAPIGPRAAPLSGREPDIECGVLVLGSGPGGYTAAFRAADLGQDVVLVERYPSLGGVCLNVGCIPSKALLHAARVIGEAEHAGHEMGIAFGQPKIDLDRLRAYKDQAVGQLTRGLSGMAGKRKVRVLQGTGTFVSPRELEVAHQGGTKLVRYGQCIIAAGSESVKLPMFPWDDERVMDSTGALELAGIPGKLLVVGGGIIGLEMACVFDALGSQVTVVELLDQLMPGTDADLVRPLAQRIGKRYGGIHLKTRVTEVRAQKNGLMAHFEGADAPQARLFDAVLVAVGRSPNGNRIGAQAAGVSVDERGYIPVDGQMRTNVRHIFAIGDIVGQPMLAHKASHEGKVAAEVAAGHRSEFVARVIPSVAYTDPEVAWVGVTETEARARGLDYGVGKFPHAASGRAIGIGRTEGFTKLLFDPASHRVIGAGIVGPAAGDLIAELALAIEMGCEAADIALTVHPHPTLSESIGMAAEVYEGTVTDLYLPKRK